MKGLVQKEMDKVGQSESSEEEDNNNKNESDDNDNDEESADEEPRKKAKLREETKADTINAQTQNTSISKTEPSSQKQGQKDVVSEVQGVNSKEPTSKPGPRA